MLKDMAETVAIARYIENMTRDGMGMPVTRREAIDFARKLEAWFEDGGNPAG